MSKKLDVNRIIFNLPLMRYLGNLIHKEKLQNQARGQSLATSFYRSLHQIRSFEGPLRYLVQGPKIHVLVTGCSLGCEVYTLAGYLNIMFPKLAWHITAIDISYEAVTATRVAHYSNKHGLGSPKNDIVRSIESNIFERSGEKWVVKDKIRDCITVQQIDVLSPQFINSFSEYDVVFGQNYLIHMADSMASQAFTSLVNVLRPEGALFVTGMDLDLRTLLSKQYCLNPIDFDLRAIHEEDHIKRGWWPWQYWSLEPFSDRRFDYLSRYATIYIK